MARAAPVIHRIGPCPAQVAHRFIVRLGNVDRGQFPGPQEPRQFARIAPVGLDPLARPGGSEGGGHHLALYSELTQAPGQPKAAPPRSLNAGSLLCHGFGAAAQSIFLPRQIVAQRPHTHFAFAPGFRHRSDHHFLMDIQSEIEFFLLGCLLVRVVKLRRSGKHLPPAVGAALLPLQNRGVARE